MPADAPPRAGVPGTPATAAPPALAVRDVVMRFGGTTALRHAALTVRAGSIHALMGGNGSGKSTLIKILAGVYRADEGSLEVFGRRTELSDQTPALASRNGLRFVHQDLGLFDALSVEENFAMDAGYPVNAVRSIRWSALRRRVRSLLADYELAIDPRRPVGALRPSDRTMIAIARALQATEGERLVLVLDEPTATLAEAESALLLDRLRSLAARGQTIVIVSHRLREVLSIANDVTVLRDGEVVAELIDTIPSEDELIGHMAGGAKAALTADRPAPAPTAPIALVVEGLRGGSIHGVDLAVRRGEIVGLAGLVGSGRSSLLEMLFGVHRPQAGRMVLDGAAYAPRRVADAMRSDVALVPESRIREASFMDRTVRENIAIAMFREYWRRRWMPRGRERRRARELIQEFGVRVQGPDALFSSMSGGNQQKVVLARWLQRSPRLLLLDEPTQGVDVMSRADIYRVVRRAADTGCMVIVASSDMTELHSLCDRILVLGGGRVVREVRARDLDIDGLTALVLREPDADDATTTTAQPGGR